MEGWVGINQNNNYENDTDDSNSSVDEDVTSLLPLMLIAGGIFEYLLFDRYHENIAT